MLITGRPQSRIRRLVRTSHAFVCTNSNGPFQDDLTREHGSKAIPKEMILKSPSCGYLKVRRPHAGIRQLYFGISTTPQPIPLYEGRAGMLVVTLICLSAAWLASAQTSKSLQSVLSGNGLSGFSLYLAQFPALSDQLRDGNVTILAPSDAGISAYLKSGEAVGNYSAELHATIQYHVLPGHLTRSQLKQTQQFLPTLAKDTPLANVTGGQKLQVYSDGQQITFQSGLKRNSNLTSTDDLQFTGPNGAGGIVHIIDSMLTLPLDLITTAKRTGISNFVDLIVSLPQDPQYQGYRDGTIFAPNGTLPFTSNFTAEALYAMEAYHVLKGVFFSPDLTDRKVYTTRNGAGVTITVQDGDTYVNDAKIIASDYLISMGVMHILDKSLSPQRPGARPPQPSWKSHLPTGAYIGIAVGVVLAVFTVAALLWHFIIRPRRRACNQQEHHNPFVDPRRICDAELSGISRKFSELHNNSRTLAELHSESAIYHELAHNTSDKDKKKVDAREIYELG